MKGVCQVSLSSERINVFVTKLRFLLSITYRMYSSMEETHQSSTDHRG